MVKRITKQRRTKYINQCDKFTEFMNKKNIILGDREFLTYKNFLWKKRTIEQSQNIIEILLGYFICDFKDKTLVICDHITSKIFSYKTKCLLNHDCHIDSCLVVVSKHELLSNLNNYLQYDWDRVVIFGSCECVPPANKYVFVTKTENQLGV
jgi:hypothetical protein